MVVVVLSATMSVFADPTFTTKEVKVNRGGVDGGKVTLRFYEDMPSVPYISVAQFQALMLPGSTVTVTKDGDTYNLQNSYATATVNTATEQFSSDDYMAFTNLMSLIQKDGMDNVYLDGAPFIRYKSQELTPATVTVTFDFGKYGIDLRGDDEAVYFPFATIADLYSDLYYHIAGYNGEEVVLATENENSDICTFDSGRALALIGQTTRPADLAEFTYKELCFVIDKFYGMPGRSAYEDVIKEYGLDKALSDNLIDDGSTIKQLLKSTDMKDYLFGMNCMQVVLYDGGHSSVYVDFLVLMKLLKSDGLNKWIENVTAMKEKYPALYFGVLTNLLSHIDPSRDNAVEAARKDKGVNDLFYYKEGDTAYLLYPQFGPTNSPAWKAYYDGGCKEEDKPKYDEEHKGDLGTVLDAMKKANDDPEVKNLIIDLAANRGGSLDIVMAITALTGGQSHFYSENTLTGQHQLITYDVDCNFDGVFDEKDKEVWKEYKLKYGVLTSKLSFSCGNALPSLMKDMGFPIIGEQCGGGACAVQNFITPEGLQFQISSYRGKLTDKNWNSIDAGVEPNYPITVTAKPDEEIKYDYSGFYDVAAISKIMNTATDITAIQVSDNKHQSDLWYTIDGRRVKAPTTKGIYVNRGRKIIVK